MAMVGAYLFKLRTEGAFSCTAEGYRTDRYMGYCDGSAYGDYDHGAVWFGLEPGVRKFASEAEVLFLGSSRMQFALSTIATDEWFAANSASHYLLGFTHTENMSFTAPLLAGLNPKAKVYVINVDRFFSDVETGPGSQILHEDGMQSCVMTKNGDGRRHIVSSARNSPESAVASSPIFEPPGRATGWREDAARSTPRRSLRLQPANRINGITTRPWRSSSSRSYRWIAAA